MTKLLKTAIEKIRELPEDMQDRAAQHLMQYVDEVNNPEELAAIIEGRRAYERGEFKPLDQWRNGVGIGDH